MDLPALVGAAMGTTPAIGGLILTVLFIGIILVPMLALKADTIVILVMAMAVTAILWGIGWAPLWLLIVEFLGLVIVLASTISGKAPRG